MRIKETDWKLFSQRLPLWQDAYMERLNNEYMAILGGNGEAAEKFWKLEERIRRDMKSSGVYVRLSRSKAIFNLVSLIKDNVITVNDLEGFSKEAIETVELLLLT